MTTLPRNEHRRARGRRRPDPVVLALALALGSVVAWCAIPVAIGAGPPSVGSSARVDLEVPATTSVTPGWKAGDTSIRMPELFLPDAFNDVSSAGWRLTTNWPGGYAVSVRSTTDPALRGLNAIDGAGAPDSFADFSTSRECPCPWSVPNAKKGVFGYSVAVTATDGGAVRDAGRWGTAAARKWRGLTRAPYVAYATAGGAGLYQMTLHLRSQVPDGAVQVEGSYRSGIVVATHPLL